MESKFTKWFCDALTRCNCHVTPIVASEMQPAGIPDRHIMHHSLPQGQVWLEFKEGNNRGREARERWCEKATKHGVHALVVRHKTTQVFLEDENRKYFGTFDLPLPNDRPVGPLIRAALVVALAERYQLE